MKTPFMLLIALIAGTASAQPPQPGQTLETSAVRPAAESRMISDRREALEFHGRRVAYGGAAVAAIKSPSHLEIFNPFDPANAGPTPDNTVWVDKSRDQAAGWSLLQIKF
jgi:hypothetical protein